MTLKTIKKNLKLVILAGGLGTRITEETTTKPKPICSRLNYPKYKKKKFYTNIQTW